MISVSRYINSNSNDALVDVLKHAYATHMACVVGYKKAYCIYPSAIQGESSRLVTGSVSRRQLLEFREWVRSEGAKPDLSLEHYNAYLGSVPYQMAGHSWMISLAPF